MTNSGSTLPAALVEANALDYDYNEGKGIDFEPYEQFLPLDECSNWFRAWTGNKDLDGAEYRVFGQDGTGGYAALWLVRDSLPLPEQPVVFFGSEGAVGVVARHLGDYLWLLAGGFGPLEAVEDPDSERIPNLEAAEVARRHASEHEKSAREVIRLARQEFPNFAEAIGALCR